MASCTSTEHCTASTALAQETAGGAAPSGGVKWGAIGAAFLSWVVIIFAVGSTDRLFFRLHISYDAQIHFWRIGVWALPIIIFFLALFGIVDAGFLWRNFRYAILIIFFLAAILTPTTDILNMCIFATPMVILFFLSIGVAWLVHPKRRKKKAATDEA